VAPKGVRRRALLAQPTTGASADADACWAASSRRTDKHLRRKTERLYGVRRGRAIVASDRCRNEHACKAEDAVIEIDYDGLLRSPVPFIDHWLSPIDLKNAGIREIPPAATRPLEIKDIDISGVESVIPTLGIGAKRRETCSPSDLLIAKPRVQTAVRSRGPRR